MLYPLLKPLLFKVKPETAHERMLKASRLISRHPSLNNWVRPFFYFEDTRLKVQIKDLYFPNPIGMAAGFDKNGEMTPLLESLGFGAVEVGTVTPLGQPGNPTPRLFRLVEDQAIINRMGFNNHGIDELCQRLATVRKNVPLGINIGKNKNTPNESAIKDYLICLEAGYELADYFTVNISSPNTPGLRDLQTEESLKPLLTELLAKRAELAKQYGQAKQIWLKLAPDLDDAQIETIAKVALDLNLDALILTNTTLGRKNLKSPLQIETGGLSGKPIQEISDAVLGKMYQATQGQIPLIGVGGIFTAEDVIRKLELGATMVQIYTGMIYQGPGMVQKLKQGLIAELDKRGLKSLAQLAPPKLQGKN